MYGTYNSICSLATTTAAIVVLGDWFPAFVFALPFSYALKRDMIVERACYRTAALLDDDDVDC
jgi:hypothetical protein